MRYRRKPLLVVIASMALLAWSWPAMPAGCARSRSCAAMHGESASCASWSSDSSCCHSQAPVGQVSSEATLGGLAAVPPFLLDAVLSNSPTPGSLSLEDQQPALVPPLYLLNSSFLI